MNLWYHVGSKNEERRQRGFAHLFEHLMFEGSEHYPGDYFGPLERVGASINGSTSSDRTNYFVDLPPAHLELALAMESDRMGHFLSSLSEEKLRIQKDVVHNEYRQNYTNRPYGQVGRILAEALYPPQHPYSWITIGVMEDLAAAGLVDVEAFFTRFYVPSNASLSIVGAVDEDRAVQLAERYFGPIAGGVRSLLPRPNDPALDQPVEIELFEPVELERLYLVRHTVPLFHPGEAALQLAADLMGCGKSSRLYRRLILEEELAQDVSASQTSREIAGTMGVSVTLRPGRSWNRAYEIIEEEWRSLAQGGPTTEELERARIGRLAGFVYALDRIGGFGGVADRLNAYNIYLGDPGLIMSDAQRYRDVTAESVQQVCARYHLEKPGVRLVVRGRKAATSSLDRKLRPEPGPSVVFRAPVPEIRQLSHGMPVWVIPRRGLPIVAASLAIQAGASAHQADRGGLAHLTADLLDEGTHSRSALDIARRVEDLGSGLTCSCGWDGSYVSIHAITSHLQESLEIAVDVATRPTFPEREWTRLHGQTLADLTSQRDRPESVTHRAFISALYPEGHGYSVPIDGTLHTVERLGRDDLVAFHRAVYQPARAAWIVAGDVDPDRIARDLEGWLPQDGISGTNRTTELKPTCTGSARVILIDRPRAAQAIVRVGQVGISRSDPDYENLAIWNQILGGKFGSRLNSRLREEKGYTYGVRSTFDTRRGVGPFFISASLEAGRLGEALVDLFAELQAMLCDRPATTAELEDARRALIEGQAQHFETPASLVSRYASLFVLGLSPDEHTRLPERLACATVDSITAAASRRVNPRQMLVVVTADAEQVLPQLERLNHATIERWSVDQVI
jgi:predicted Zn-dependent peptidase